ncbi:21321_t:CDS:2, partial [Cetraspora pellucida]
MAELLAEVLYVNTSLEELCGEALAGALCVNTTLIKLDLGQNQLGSEGAVALAKALCENNTLNTLILTENRI